MGKRGQVVARGRPGNVILYRWKGIACARIAPGRVRQTKATKQSAKDFGRAVKLSKILRTSLFTSLHKDQRREIMYKFNAALLGWFRQEKPIEEHLPFIGLELNDKSAFSSRFRKELLVNFKTKGKIILTVPRLKLPDDIAAPSNTSLIRMEISAAGSMIDMAQLTDVAGARIEIPYKDGWLDEITKELAFTCKPQSINVVVASLHYITRKDGRETVIAEERWTPAAVVAARVG